MFDTSLLDPIIGISSHGRTVYEYMLYIIKLHYGGDKYTHSFDANIPPIESGIPVNEWKMGLEDLKIMHLVEFRLNPDKIGLI